MYRLLEGDHKIKKPEARKRLIQLGKVRKGVKDTSKYQPEQEEDVIQNERAHHMSADELESVVQAYSGTNLNVSQSKTGWDNLNNTGFLEGLPDFNYNEIENDAFCLNIGRRRCGKTTNTDYLLYNKRHVFPMGIVFTHTKFNGFWQKRVPSDYIHERYEPEILRELFKRQKHIIAMGEQSPIVSNAFVIFDDCVSQDELKYDSEIRELAAAGRHYDIFSVINTQYAYGIGPLLRGNSDTVFLFDQAQHRQREAVTQDFMDRFDKRSAMKLLDSVTAEKHACLAIDIQTSKMYRAKPGKLPDEDYKLGCKEFWGDML
jgi:hypothetical protein